MTSWPSTPAAIAEDVPPAGAGARLAALLDSARVAYAVHALAELGIAELLADGPADVAALAESAGCDPGALRRLLRAGAFAGVFRANEAGSFALTPMGQALRREVPGSRLPSVLYQGRIVFPAYRHLAEAVRTGGPVFERAFGLPFYDYLDRNTTENELTYLEAHDRDRHLVTHCVARVDWSGCHRIADVGGGTGAFLAFVLARVPQARGVLYDRPEVLPVSKEFLVRQGMGGRVELAGGDFYTDPLPPADMYLLKNTVHSLDDADAVRLLGHLRDAMRATPGARLLICERVVPDGDSRDEANLLDIDMLLLHGGRERTVAEWREVLRAAGLRWDTTAEVLLCTAE
ncbi:methyltransferase [Amycolatopsis sp. NPDC059021]|uniref:methyltransferase n=1 Tax=Amycolatopsis sp. NPDC059021 TaxID=3346704 RepID=UPI00366D4BC5